jgi:hypothetical protein
MPDSSPQVTPVWIGTDENYILVNSANGRQKDCNERNRKIAVSIRDPNDPFRYWQVRGTVVEIPEQGADDHIDGMAMKNLELERYSYCRQRKVRVLNKIAPEFVFGL